MRIAKNLLTDKAIKAVKATGVSQRLSDQNGLYLEITSSNSKIWRMRVRLKGKDIRLTFGHYPYITLKRAREKGQEILRMIEEGIDPRQVKIEEEAALKAKEDSLFENLARAWHTDRQREWKSNTARSILSRFERDVFPFIGDKPIADIQHSEIINVLKSVEKRGVVDVARKIKVDISRVYKYAIQRGIIKYNPVNDLDGVLNKATRGHFKSIKLDELSEFLDALDKNLIRMFVPTRVAIRLMLLLFMRTSELIEAEWSEINLETGRWVIPWHRMKMGRRKINPDKTDHIIDLPSQAIGLLKDLKRYSGNRRYLFPSQRNPRAHMSNGAILMALKRMGYHGRMTGHGFRALAASALEEMGYRREVVERQLAHKERNNVQAAYYRAEFLDERKKMLQQWADYVDSCLQKC